MFYRILVKLFLCCKRMLGLYLRCCGICLMFFGDMDVFWFCRFFLFGFFWLGKWRLMWVILIKLLFLMDIE